MMSCNSNADILSRKAELRRELRKKRSELGAEEQKSASLAVSKRIIALDAYRDAKLILAYMAAKGELDVAPIIEDALRKEKKVAFPLCIENGGLRLLVPNTQDAFNLGMYGILEPDEMRSKEVDASDIDLIIVPAVTFNEDCLRLGQGGGYYDRLLTKTDAFTIGVGYDFQLKSDIPVEKHDRSLDCVALPCGLFFGTQLKTDKNT